MMVIVFGADVEGTEETPWIAPMNLGGLVNGSETNVSELLRHEVVVKQTGSVVAACMPPRGTSTNAAAKKKIARRIERIALAR